MSNSTLVDRIVDNPAARIATQEIAERVQLAAQCLTVPAVAPQRLLAFPGLAYP